MFTNHVFILIIFNTLIVFKYTNADCTFEYNGDYPEIPSVIFIDSLTLLEPENDPIRFNNGQQIILGCPGSGNKFQKFNEQYKIANCVQGKYLSISGISYKLSELGCIKKVESDCQITINPCGNSLTGNLVDVGYKISNNMPTLFQVCYDYNRNVPLYAQQKIYGATISYSKGSPSRPTFKDGCLSPSIPKKLLDDAYVQTTQLDRFTKLLSSNKLGKQCVIKFRSYLAKGHLNADVDQVFNTTKPATYLYINTLPMWQRINNGNWKSLEDTIRTYARKTKDNLVILTGGHDVLKLPNCQARDIEIYLDDTNKVAVPKYIWKIVYSPRSNQGIAFIALNNPFHTPLMLPTHVCRNNCNTDYNWGTMSWRNPEGGLLYCCSIQDLAQMIPQIPSFYSNINLVLRGV